MRKKVYGIFAWGDLTTSIEEGNDFQLRIYETRDEAHAVAKALKETGIPYKIRPITMFINEKYRKDKL